MTAVLALSLSSEIEKYGAYAGLAAVVGLGVLSLLYFAQAREVKRLREWAGRAPERDADVQQRVVEEAQRRAVVPAPRPRPAAPATPAAAAVAAAGTSQPSAPAGPPGTPTGPRPPVPATAAALAAKAGAAAPATNVPGAPAPSGPAAPAVPAAPGQAPSVAPLAAPPQAPAAQPASSAPSGPPPAPAKPAAAPDAVKEAPGAPVPQAPGGMSPAPKQPAAAAAASPPPPAASPAPATSPPAPPATAATAAARPAAPASQPQPAPAAGGAGSPPRPRPRPAGAQRAEPPARPPAAEGSRRGLVGVIVGGVAIAAVAVLLITQVFNGDDTSPARPNTVGTPTTDASGQPVAQSRPQPKRDTTRVAVFNGTTVNGLARAAADKLTAAGYKNVSPVRTDTTNQARPTTAVYWQSGSRREGVDTARIIGVAKSALVAMDQNARVLSGGAPVVVFIGADQAQ